MSGRGLAGAVVISAPSSLSLESFGWGHHIVFAQHSCSYPATARMTFHLWICGGSQAREGFLPLHCVHAGSRPGPVLPPVLGQVAVMLVHKIPVQGLVVGGCPSTTAVNIVQGFCCGGEFPDPHAHLGSRSLGLDLSLRASGWSRKDSASLLAAGLFAPLLKAVGLCLDLGRGWFSSAPPSALRILL